MVSGLGHAVLLAWGLVAFSIAPKPMELDAGESVPVEVVSDAPASARKGVKTAEDKPDPSRVIDRQAAEEKETEDEEETPVAKQVVKNTTPPPPPAPRPRPTEAQTQQKVAAVQPPAPAPRPKPEAEKEDTDKEAELAAAKKLEEKKKLDEQKKLEEQKKAEADRKKAEDDKKKQLAEEKRKADEKKLADLKSKLDGDRQSKANARTFDPNSIASRLNSQDASNDRRQASRTEATGNAAPTRTASLGTATGMAAKLSATEMDALRAQVQQCWNVPAAAANAQKLIVRVQFSLNPDGSVAGRPEVVNRSGDPAFAAAASSAVRAIMQCGSNGRRFTLPASKYEAWRDVAINFDPADMFR